MQTHDSVQTSQTVLTILEGVKAVVLLLSWRDDPLDLDEVFQIVADGQRTDPGERALVLAKSALDGQAIVATSGVDTVDAIDSYTDGDAAPLYRRLLFERGKAGLVTCLDETINATRRSLTQLPMWLA